ncbi:MAG: tetratricopeptide repeat protein [Thalassotalea sp.]
MKKTILFISLTLGLMANATASQKDVALALENNQLATAESAYTALPATEKSSLAGQILYSRILMSKDNTEEAYDMLEALREDHANNVEIEYRFGQSAVVMAQKASIFSKLGYASDFLEAMEKTIELKPDHLEALDYLVGFHLGAPSIAGGDTDKALLYAQQMKKLAPERGFSQLANVYWQTGQTELAQKTITAGITAYPESSNMYASRAGFYIKNKNWQQARTDLKQAIKYAENDKQKGQSLYQQGKVSAESGEEIDLGINALVEALPLAGDKHQPWVKYRLAQLHTYKKDKEKAQSYLAQINTDKDDNLKKEVKKLKKKLKKMKV